MKETPPLAFDSTGNCFISAAVRASEFIYRYACGQSHLDMKQVIAMHVLHSMQIRE